MKMKHGKQSGLGKINANLPSNGSVKNTACSADLGMPSAAGFSKAIKSGNSMAGGKSSKY